MKQYSVAVVGIGVVGAKMLEVLRERKFPAKSYKVLATRARKEMIAGYEYEVVPASVEAFDGVDIAFFAGTEGAKGASQLYGWQAVAKGCIVIDNGDDYRMDPRVPLVVPEVNAEALRGHKGFISNPNCSTIQMVVALGALQKHARIKRVVVSTYQAVSGTGRPGIAELEQQLVDLREGRATKHETYPHQIAFNVIPQVSSLKTEFPGYYGEEIKMIKETRKILGDPDIQVSATCVRVPVFNAHSEAVNVQLDRKITAAEAREILRNYPGIVLMDDPAKSVYPTPLAISGRDEVFVGRIRDDSSAPNSLDLWVVSDNIRKGAATNAVQIAEKMMEMKLI
ncbi:MAG: aspartate-semialdehyde dehydrogenase [Planctomycetes bacterium]|nr:aspartate-semialdehyde dehydrogenase [Planctomycetota bacterium]